MKLVKLAIAMLVISTIGVGCGTSKQKQTEVKVADGNEMIAQLNVVLADLKYDGFAVSSYGYSMIDPTCVKASKRSTIKINLQRATNLAADIKSIIDSPNIIYPGDASQFERIRSQCSAEYNDIDSIPNCK